MMSLSLEGRLGMSSRSYDYVTEEIMKVRRGITYDMIELMDHIIFLLEEEGHRDEIIEVAAEKFRRLVTSHPSCDDDDMTIINKVTAYAIHGDAANKQEAKQIMLGKCRQLKLFVRLV